MSKDKDSFQLNTRAFIEFFANYMLILAITTLFALLSLGEVVDDTFFPSFPNGFNGKTFWFYAIACTSTAIGLLVIPIADYRVLMMNGVKKKQRRMPKPTFIAAVLGTIFSAAGVLLALFSVGAWLAGFAFCVAALYSMAASIYWNNKLKREKDKKK